MAKPNYAFEKRQRELVKKKKKEEKAARKAQGRPAGDEASPQDDTAAPDGAGSTEAGEAPDAAPDDASGTPGPAAR